ncbi:MAG: DUF4351 domain-containing protein [Candidatus Latescibacterota bacterium]
MARTTVNPLIQPGLTHDGSFSRAQWIQVMSKTIAQHFIEEGRAEGAREVLIALLRARFGYLSPEVEQRLKGRTVPDMCAVAARLPHARSLEELEL